MSLLKLIVSIVPHDKGERLTRAAVNAGCGGGSVVMGRGLAKSNLAAILGFGESTKDIIYMVVEDSKKEQIIEAIKKSTSNEKKDFGELFTLNVESMLKSNVVFQGEEMMNEEKSKDMITVIVNKGYADDVMFVARKAGATGGTVINARGTAKEDDENFFGMHIVPEKDMLIIVVDHNKKTEILNAIKELKCLKEPGMGIAFNTSIDDFELLGQKK